MRVKILLACVRPAKYSSDTDELPKFTVTRRVGFSPQQIFSVVADVGSYREFLPLVERSTVRNRKSLENGSESFSADLLIGYHKMGIEETFTSKVETIPEQLIVKADSTGNAVKKLVSSWQITGIDAASSDITFFVDYEMKSAMLQMIMGSIFDAAVRKIMNAFEARAASLYTS
jgi:coenzyme Q-binding protein COQ10